MLPNTSFRKLSSPTYINSTKSGQLPTAKYKIFYYYFGTIFTLGWRGLTLTFLERPTLKPGEMFNLDKEVEGEIIFGVLPPTLAGGFHLGILAMPSGVFTVNFRGWIFSLESFSMTFLEVATVVSFLTSSLFFG